jgi:hypothetical protein
LKAHLLLLKKPNKNGLPEYKPKYDLTQYRLRLNPKIIDQFILEPIDSNSSKRVEFKTMSAEDRHRWFIAMTKAKKETELEFMSFLNASN